MPTIFIRCGAILMATLERICFSGITRLATGLSRSKTVAGKRLGRSLSPVGLLPTGTTRPGGQPQRVFAEQQRESQLTQIHSARRFQRAGVAAPQAHTNSAS